MKEGDISRSYSPLQAEPSTSLPNEEIRNKLRLLHPLKLPNSGKYS